MNAANLARAKELLQAFPKRSSAMMPILHLVEGEFGCIPEDEKACVASLMQCRTAEVEAVLSFYTLFHRQPRGRTLVQVCRGLSCHLCGSDDLARSLYLRLGVGRDETTSDGRFTVEEVECLALCKDAPVLQVNLEYRPRATEADLERLVAGVPADA